MKKVFLIIIITIIASILFIKFFDYLFSSSMYSITGSIEEATLNSDGNIVIIDEEITNQPAYITYNYDDVSIGILAIRNSKDKVVVVVNNCISCDDYKNAYYILKKNKLECKSCNYKIAIDDLDISNNNGCDPIKIEERKDENGKIIIGTKQLRELKDKFKNWNGPK